MPGPGERKLNLQVVHADDREVIRRGGSARSAAASLAVAAAFVLAGLPVPVASASPAMLRPRFDGPAFYGVGANAVVTADFTGDGRVDVAAAYPSEVATRTVSLLVQTAGGALAEPQLLAAHTGYLATVSAIAADVDADGDQDLLVGSSGGIDLFEQRSGGLLPARLISDLQTYELDAADVNGDGRIDLVVDTYFTSGLRTMLGSGGGEFAAPVVVSTDYWAYSEVRVTDITGDGIADIVGKSVTLIHVRAGVGDGTFAPVREYVVPWPSDGGSGLAVGDFNGDGRADVAVTNSRNSPLSRLWVLYQTPAGSLGAAVPLATRDLAEMLDAADMNLDGRMDLVTAHTGWDYAGVYLQQPDGTFAAEQLEYIGRWYFRGSSGLDLGDINGDGRPDIVTGSDAGLVILRSSALTTDDGGFHTLAPARVLDTRNGTGGVSGPIGSAATVDVPVTGRGGVPASGVSAVVMNVTVTQPSTGGYLTVFPSGTARPVASNLNFLPGQTVPNLVVAAVGRTGKVSLYNNAGSTHVVIDVMGWYDNDGRSTGTHYNALSPSRILDTRNGTGGLTGPVGPASAVDVAVAGRGGVPAGGVSAVVVNVTVTQPSTGGFLTVFPSGIPRPLASNLNFVAGETVPNLVVAKVGADGKLSVYNNAGSTHVILDVVGWYDTDGRSTGSHYNPLRPARIVDSRDWTGGVVGPVGPETTVDVTVAGRGGVPPSGVSAVALNVTVTEPTAVGYLTVFPNLTTRPLASNLNFVAGQTVPNFVVAKVGPDGKIALFNNAGSTHVIVDVVGWYPT